MMTIRAARSGRIEEPAMEEIDSLQDKLLRRVEPSDMSRLILLKRALVHLRRALGPQRDIFNQLTRRDSPFVRPESAVYFRDVYDHLIRLIEELDSMRELLSGALEIHVTSASNQLNETIKRLSAWGTIFIVITVIASIYGMNFEHMPELGWRYGYPAILATMAATAAGLYLYFKRRGYL
jgi:magnesium transporter